MNQKYSHEETIRKLKFGEACYHFGARGRVDG
jgi:hypothetical protein